MTLSLKKYFQILLLTAGLIFVFLPVVFAQTTSSSAGCISGQGNAASITAAEHAAKERADNACARMDANAGEGICPKPKPRDQFCPDGSKRVTYECYLTSFCKAKVSCKLNKGADCGALDRKINDAKAKRDAAKKKFDAAQADATDAEAAAKLAEDTFGVDPTTAKVIAAAEEALRAAEENLKKIGEEINSKNATEGGLSHADKEKFDGAVSARDDAKRALRNAQDNAGDLSVAYQKAKLEAEAGQNTLNAPAPDNQGYKDRINAAADRVKNSHNQSDRASAKAELDQAKKALADFNKNGLKKLKVDFKKAKDAAKAAIDKFKKLQKKLDPDGKLRKKIKEAKSKADKLRAAAQKLKDKLDELDNELKSLESQAQSAISCTTNITPSKGQWGSTVHQCPAGGELKPAKLGQPKKPEVNRRAIEPGGKRTISSIGSKSTGNVLSYRGVLIPLPSIGKVKVYSSGVIDTGVRAPFAIQPVAIQRPTAFAPITPPVTPVEIIPLQLVSPPPVKVTPVTPISPIISPIAPTSGSVQSISPPNIGSGVGSSFGVFGGGGEGFGVGGIGSPIIGGGGGFGGVGSFGGGGLR